MNCDCFRTEMFLIVNIYIMMKHKLFLFLAVASLALVGCENAFTPSPGCFTISKTQQVKFAPGNLQAVFNINPATGAKEYTYSFASKQWECLGRSKPFVGEAFDLFGWGTGDEPDRVVDSGAAYRTFVDWGNYTIRDPQGKPTSGWRTLSYEEWNYVINERPNAAKLRCAAQIDGTPGMLLLPDTWSLGDVRHAFTNNYSDTIFLTTDPNNTDWQKFEEAGAVFLPAAGVRAGQKCYGYQNFGRYWTSTDNIMTAAFFFGFMNPTEYQTGLRQWGFAVRLAKDQ